MHVYLVGQQGPKKTSSFLVVKMKLSVKMVWFCLFNGIPNFMGYLMQ